VGVATLVPSFREFLPAWVAAQPWYRGDGVPTLSIVAVARIQDPAGQVGMESHLITDGRTVYHVPMTYRGAPLPTGAGLITTARHSELGPRWLYDAEHDPLWRTEMLRLMETGSATEPQAPDGPGAGIARGIPGGPSPAVLEVRRIVTEPVDEAGIVVCEWPGGRGGLAVWHPSNRAATNP
jgi:hypothetical protein